MRYQRGIRLASACESPIRRFEIRHLRIAAVLEEACWRRCFAGSEPGCHRCPGSAARAKACRYGVGIDRVVAERSERLLVSRDLGVHTAKLLRVYIRSKLQVDEEIDDSLSTVARSANSSPRCIENAKIQSVMDLAYWSPRAFPTIRGAGKLTSRRS